MDKIDISNEDHFEFCYKTNKEIGKITQKILADTAILQIWLIDNNIKWLK